MKLISIILAALLAQSTFAATKIDQPEACPDINLLKSIGVNAAIKKDNNYWNVANLKNNYNTPQVWSLISGIGEANDEADAIKKVNAALTGLVLLAGPMEGQVSDEVMRWECLYSADGDHLGYMAVAVTPSFDSMPRGISGFKR